MLKKFCPNYWVYICTPMPPLPYPMGLSNDSGQIKLNYGYGTIFLIPDYSCVISFFFPLLEKIIWE